MFISTVMYVDKKGIGTLWVVERGLMLASWSWRGGEGGEEKGLWAL